MEGAREAAGKKADAASEELEGAKLCPTCRQAWPERDDVKVAASALRCPFCHETVAPEKEAWVACEGCLARHHASCWKESGACATCRGTRAVTSTATTARRRGNVGVILVVLGAVAFSALSGLFIAKLSVADAPSSSLASESDAVRLVRYRDCESRLATAIDDTLQRGGTNIYYSLTAGTIINQPVQTTVVAQELDALAKDYESVGRKDDAGRLREALHELGNGQGLGKIRAALKKVQ